MSSGSPEKQILTRLFLVQRRLRFTRGLHHGLRWFALGSLLAAVGMIALWNWNRLPGPWQWAASSGRPAELLWLPLLCALGGFAGQWLSIPSARESAHRVDRLRDSQDRLLTAVDWILSEKPRTVVSERLLARAAADLQDESRLRADLRRLEPLPLRRSAWLVSLLLPLLLWLKLPTYVGLPESAALWLGPNQVDRLTEQLARELEQARKLDQPAAKLKELMKKLEDEKKLPPDQRKALEALQRELQQATDSLKSMAAGQESARELLETLAQRARAGETMSPEDRAALAELRKLLEQPADQGALERAQSDWARSAGESAAEQLEQLQQETGQNARDLQQMAAEGEQALGQEQATEGDPGEGEGQGMEFDESQGDQHSKGPGQKPGSGHEGRGPADFGSGTTEQEETGGNASGLRSRRESERTSNRVEEFRSLHEPIRTQEETSQTRVSGQLDPQGPRRRTRDQGRGMVTEPARSESGETVLRYREGAENAILREEIPAAHRDEVRQYFEGLDR